MDNLEKKLEALVTNTFSPHPFSTITKDQDLEKIFSRFIGLSQATPYLLGGASKEMFFKLITNDKQVNPANEVTTSVLSFLAWDETGGQQVVREFGEHALYRILESNNYHSRILVTDLQKLLGKTISPVYEKYTIDYFKQLLDSLSDLDDIKRCASIVAFEMHAEQVIIALWNSVDKIFPSIDKHTLKYFELHVGELNPVEEYHVEMTTKMVEMIVPKEKHDDFLAAFKLSYKLNKDWSNYAVNEK